MPFVTDLHIHSRFSRATSRELNLAQLYASAQMKGIAVLGTGDMTHPQWRCELKEQLVESGEGLFQLRTELAREAERTVPKACKHPVRFMLTGEISTIYKRDDKVRKVHHLICAPDFESVERLSAALSRIGNLTSDGRPILGLDSRDLLETVLDSGPHMVLIPAHIWTPWFSSLGSKSGFDSIQDCYGPLTDHVFAVETGLSSDPPMNWRVSSLDGFTLVSNSDAHSAGKLAREANLFNTDWSYHEMMGALRNFDKEKFLGTVEFFPEEGKYHLDGHRKCEVRLSPQETKQVQGLCPTCQKPVTVGVMHRVETLADRVEGIKPKRASTFISLVPLDEVLGEVLARGAATQEVAKLRTKLLTELGPEIPLLRDWPLEEVARVATPRLAEALRRMRCGEVQRLAGYDGEFGSIRLFRKEESEVDPQIAIVVPRAQSSGRTCIASPKIKKPFRKKDKGSLESRLLVIQKASNPSDPVRTAPVPALGESTSDQDEARLFVHLNPEQENAVVAPGPLLVLAGPGTGKTRVLTYRLAHQIKKRGMDPHRCLAVTFTNRAAEEMRSRLQKMFGDRAASIWICTFHGLGFRILAEQGVGTHQVLDEAGQIEVLQQAAKKIGLELDQRDLRARLVKISQMRQGLLKLQAPDPNLATLEHAYQKEKEESMLWDWDDLILLPLKLFEQDAGAWVCWQDKFDFVAVDEFQDLNAVQYRLLMKLVGDKGRKLCVIGDPDQAIYGFRGADVRWFWQIQQDHPDINLIRLTQNYRSTPQILGASFGVISQSNAEHRLLLQAQLPNGNQVFTVDTATEKAEAEFVAHSIEKWMGGVSHFSIDSDRSVGESQNLGFCDFAVLYRVGAQANSLCKALKRLGLPVQVAGDEPLWQREEAKDLLAYLRLIASPEDSPVLIRKSQLPRPRLEKTAIAGLRLASKHQAAADLMDQILQLSGLEQRLPVGEKGERIRETWQGMIHLARQHGPTMKGFLDWLALARPEDDHDPRSEKVSLLTMHAAKGLEFPIVFITGCEEGLIPWLPEEESADGLAEERRLFYVGMTRAQQTLVLTRARSRMLFGKRRQSPPSPFLIDIEEALRQQVAPFESGKKKKSVSPQMKLL